MRHLYRTAVISSATGNKNDERRSATAVSDYQSYQTRHQLLLQPFKPPFLQSHKGTLNFHPKLVIIFHPQPVEG